MQIGTRWRADAEAPEQVPEALREALSAADVSADGYWTLTWLENRPVATHDDGVVLALQPNGSVGEPPHAVLDEPDDPAENDDLFPVE